MSDITNMVERYGACALLKMLIDANIEQLSSPSKGSMPGLEYLNNELIELYKKIQNDIIGDIGQMICNFGMFAAGNEGGDSDGYDGETD